ncbi:MAG: trypsin-like peptidase domain-containing protein [Longimicrobiales bacterium]|nr:trypsin-like peptidase domain-containing protein [Longimicrobiales bacterium]
MRITPYRFITLAVLAVVALTVTVWPSDRPAQPAPTVYRFATTQAEPAPATSAGAAVQAPESRREGTLGEARSFSRAFADVAEAVIPAVVRIQSEHDGLQSRLRDRFDLPEGHPMPDFPTVAGGSGVLVTSHGLILTNYHVIAGARRITVTLWDKRRFDATVVGTDPTTDLALIVIDEGGLPAARLGDSGALRVGEWVLAVGNPGFRNSNTLDFTVTGGIVSAKGRPLDVIQDELARAGNPAAVYAIEDFIQTDAAINPGNSGGPLIDLDGTVVGINTAIASVTGANQGYGFAVPINVARRVMDDLLEYGRVRRPLLGISILNITPEDAQVYDLDRISGVLVEDFADDSPAERAGLQRHDVIVAVDGAPVERIGQFQRLIAGYDPGDRVTVDVVRYGEPERFTVELTEADLGGDAVVRTTARRPAASPELGLELVDLTPSLAREREFSRPEGALITDVSPGSPASRRGVPSGVVIREINRTPISSARQARAILGRLPSGGVASLLLEDAGGTTRIRNVRIP